MEFGNNLKQFRKGKGLTQEEFAECINVSPQTVSKWENNLSMPDISMLPVLADYFKITVDALIAHDVESSASEMKELSKRVHLLADEGKTVEAYNTLKADMGKWGLSASINHLMSWCAYMLSKESGQKNKQELLEEAIMYADRATRLDGGETSKTVQAKMTKCFCLVDLGRNEEAIKIANSLPSMYSSRERILAKITEGEKQQENIDIAIRYLQELLAEMRRLKED